MFPQIGNRKIILYAPTFRGDSIAKSYIKNMLKIDEMYEALSKDYVLLIKQHPLTAKAFKLGREQLEKYSDFVGMNLWTYLDFQFPTEWIPFANEEGILKCLRIGQGRG